MGSSTSNPRRRSRLSQERCGSAPSSREGQCVSRPITLQAFMHSEATALSGFGLLCGVSYTGGHSVLLQTVLLARHDKKETMSPTALDFKNFHGCQTVPRWSP